MRRALPLILMFTLGLALGLVLRPAAPSRQTIGLGAQLWVDRPTGPPDPAPPGLAGPTPFERIQLHVVRVSEGGRTTAVDGADLDGEVWRLGVGDAVYSIRAIR